MLPSSKRSDTIRLSVALWIATLSIFSLYLLSRLYHLLALPPFIDEYLHIVWAQDVYRRRFLTGAENGRLLALWYMYLIVRRPRIGLHLAVSTLDSSGWHPGVRYKIERSL